MHISGRFLMTKHRFLNVFSVSKSHLSGGLQEGFSKLENTAILLEQPLNVKLKISQQKSAQQSMLHTIGEHTVQKVFL
jgi:hypothetical protein